MLLLILTGLLPCDQNTMPFFGKMPSNSFPDHLVLTWSVASGFFATSTIPMGPFLDTKRAG
jgi:hypothetical protein